MKKKTIYRKITKQKKLLKNICFQKVQLKFRIPRVSSGKFDINNVRQNNKSEKKIAS